MQPGSKTGFSAEVKRHRDGYSYGGEEFLLPTVIQTISIAPLHVHQCCSEPLHTTELIHATARSREGRTCAYDKANGFTVQLGDKG